MDELDKPTILLKPFTQALNNGKPQAIYKNYRKLYEIGESIIPAIESELMAYTWDNIKYGAQINILSGLLSLANDINEVRAKELGQKLEANGCNEAVRTRIKSILDFSLDDFTTYSLSGIVVYQSKDLSYDTRIKEKMTKWLSMVPNEDLKNIERLYLIPKDEACLGTYQPILCNIMIVWDIYFSYYNPLSFFELLSIENTLYHEIGHHVNQHTFGQIPRQEKEADRYAAEIFRKTHPILRKIVRSVKYVFKFLKTFQKKNQ